MSLEPPAKRVRKGTKSCSECRRRKVRCVWPSSTAECCEYCLARSLTCEQQSAPTPHAEITRISTRARLTGLEQDISSIWSAVRALQEKAGIEDNVPHTRESWSTRNQDSGRYEESDLGSSEDLTPADAPVHLLHLFDNTLLGSHGHGVVPALRAQPSAQKSHGTAELKALLPSQNDMLIIASHAPEWLNIYAPLFRIVSVEKTPEDMLLQYDRLIQDGPSDPVKLASLLLLVSITVQHNPDEISKKAPNSFRDIGSFLRDVAETVDRIVISDDYLAGSLSGLQSFLLYLRFQMGRAKISKVWLQLRRAIALAEMIGLPRAVMVLGSIQEDSRGSASAALQSTSVDQLKQKAEVWESLLALDRMSSVMWSLPLATANFTWKKKPVIDEKGHVVPQVYLYYLADIASRILDLDNMYSSGKSSDELFEAAMRTDQELKTLSAYPPRDWWRGEAAELNIDMLLQFWTHYMTVRTHIQLAVTYDGHKPVASLNFSLCLSACQDLAKRYISLRPLIPANFFASWLIDTQAFTGVIFLLLARYRVLDGGIEPGIFQFVDVKAISGLVDQIVLMMASATGYQGENFSRPAAVAVRSLDSLLRATPTQESQHISLKIPLVGRIQIHKKPAEASVGPPDAAPKHHQSQRLVQEELQPQEPTPANDRTVAPPVPYVAESYDTTDLLSYSMEIPESYAFLSEDMFSNDQWLTWSQ